MQDPCLSQPMREKCPGEGPAYDDDNDDDNDDEEEYDEGDGEKDEDDNDEDHDEESLHGNCMVNDSSS